ncbi:alpha/beta fold hydrolase [Micromonospora sp. NBC_01796]|uniref:alpha/beta fold hydrolase n=1 Tax=Micromonospora sp. NBC_01796 TaxID=2975987 RepID=UPI002DDB4215|nr:alpha/beta hydrolase [Micromonospora sp. NBC_01796]WSA89474.1 alpha/beta hydrolase [Micromonospora sp. NBC_01796]
MAKHADCNGVKTWYDERGNGDPVLLLHGGLTDSRSFTGNLDALASRFRLFLPDRRGHGHTADVPGPITAELMAQDMIAFLDRVVGGPARLVGYSAGASVALLVALRRPDLVERLVLVSAAFHADGLIFRPTAGGEPPAQLVEAYAEVSPDGADHFPAVIDKIARAVAEEPGLTVADLGEVTCRTLVLAGDDDLVTLDHTVELYRGLRDGELAIIPAASHLLLFEHPELCLRLITGFLTTDRPPTFMPIRRADNQP